MENRVATMDAEQGASEKVEVRVEPRLMSAPQEGGCRGWSVVVASFICNGIIFGIINSVGTICGKVQKTLHDAGDTDAAAKASLVGSLAIGMTFFTSAVAGVLTDHLGIRTTAVIGGILSAGGMLASSFFCDSVGALYFTFGIIFGVGASLVYTPSLVILGHYFHRSLGVVNGFVTAGSSVFTLVMPHVLAVMIKAVDLSGCFLFLTALTCIMIGCGIVFKPVAAAIPAKKRKSLGGINTALFRRPRYLVWTIAMPVALLGYFVPYIHTETFIKGTQPDCDGNILITCIAAMSLVSRLVCGPLADLPRVDSVVLQQISFALLGLLTMLLVAVQSWTLLILLALGMGICDGFSITLIGPIAFQLCGKEGASQAIGFLLGLCSIPMTVGPFLAGFLYDQVKSYTLPYVMSGGLTILGAAIMCLMHCCRKDAVGDKQTTSPDAVEFQVMRPLFPEADLSETRSLPPSYKDVIAAKTKNGLVKQERST